ncbi:hypothetical protein V1477_002157 [Vespula maculifrons]|uniref:Uncharacterized protein n=1 Tax=Vespula maculifrons TaxID=7453 RepID=A0ABD2CVQ0_VESMC
MEIDEISFNNIRLVPYFRDKSHIRLGIHYWLHKREHIQFYNPIKQFISQIIKGHQILLKILFEKDRKPMRKKSPF